MYGQYMPIIMLTVATFTLIEAAGAADEYPALKGTSKVTLEKLNELNEILSQRDIVLISIVTSRATAICSRREV